MSFILLSACGGGSSGDGDDGGAIPVTLSTFQAAETVIGQADFAGELDNQGGAPGANTLAFPVGAPSEGSLYLADQDNHRILGFNAIPTTNNASADFVIGQADFVSNTSGTGANSFIFPGHTVTANGKLFVLDNDNRRVLIWNSLPTSNVPADVVVGAPDFTTPGSGATSQTTISFPGGMAVAGGHLFVSDQGSSRVLIWNNIPTGNNAPADVVLGQVNFTDSASGLTDSNLRGPTGVWSDGVRVAVADSINNRDRHNELIELAATKIKFL